MTTVYLAVAREDNWETSTKVVGMYPSHEAAEADLAKRFKNLCDSSKSYNRIWESDEFTSSDVVPVAYLCGEVGVSWGSNQHNIVILKQNISE